MFKLLREFLKYSTNLINNERGEVDSDDGGDGDGDGAAGDVQQQLTQLTEQLNLLKGETDTLKASKTDLEQRLDEADRELLSDDYLEFKDGKSRRSSSSSKSDGDVLDGIDLDRASNKEIASFIEKKYKGDLDLAVKDIRKELDVSKQTLGMMAAQFDVALTTMRHTGGDGKPSFAENQKAIFDIAKANPRWDAEKCYQQFVLVSKADLEKKKEDDRKKAEEEEKAATERAGVPSSTAVGKQLSDVDAADLAYKKAFGNSD